MASVIELLDGIDLPRLTDQLESAKLTVSADGSVELRGFDPRDLLGDLGEILKSPEAFAISPEAAADITTQPNETWIIQAARVFPSLGCRRIGSHGYLTGAKSARLCRVLEPATPARRPAHNT